MKSAIENRKSKMVRATDGSPIKVLKPDLRFNFGPKNPVLAVRQLIERHVGAENAITIEGIGLELWPNEWWFVHAESKGFPVYPYRVKIQRDVKEIVRGLRRQSVRIGSSRGSGNAPPGYYLISTPEEQASTLGPLFNQALDQLETCAAMTGRDMFVAELRAERKFLGVSPGKPIITEATEGTEAR
jgi:hypothetical protein